MNFSKFLLENRIDDFKNKYSRKFSQEQIDRLVDNVPHKFLDWVGKTFDSIGFEDNFQNLIQSLKKFEKISSNLKFTDINQYKDLSQLTTEIENFENRARRDYKKVEGGNVVYDDARFFVVNPQTHQASCHYGAGTKWCTAADSDYQFNSYNNEGKLFYILDRTKPTSDPYYKIALLKKFDGNESYFDAIDKSFSNFESLVGPEVYSSIMKSIREYMNQEYAEQIKIFTDAELAKKERERIRRVQIQRILNQRRAQAEERRLDDEWELDPNCPDVGLKAYALLQWLENQGDVEVKTEQDKIEIQNIKERIERLQEQSDNSEEVETELLDEISDLEDTLQELEEKIDVYNIIPVGVYYDLTKFEVIDAGLDDRGYAVGDEDEMKSSCYDYVEQLIDDIGYEGFNKDFAMNYIDTDSVMDTARDFFSHNVYESPESYFDEDERMLSDSQEERIEILKEKIERAEQTKQSLEDMYDGEDETIEEKISELDEIIEECQSEIEDIESDPDGDFPEDLYEEKIEELVSDIKRDPESFISDYGLDWNNYIDKDEFIDGVIDADGYGHTINSYDGTADEEKVLDTWYWVMRID